MTSHLWLTQTDDPGDWSRWLAAWRLWLAAALVGALLAVALYRLVPPPYRARAQVVVDHDLEAARPVGTDRHLFYYLSRENKKLEALAWADDVLQAPAAALAVSPADLRRGSYLTLRQEKDGLWHFWATADQPSRARTAAAAWARAFTEAAQQAAAAAREAELLAEQQRALAETLAQTRFLCQHVSDVQRDLAATPPPPDASPWQAWSWWERLTWLDGGAWPLPPWPRHAADGRALQRAALELAQARADACPQRIADLEIELENLRQAREDALRRARGVSPFIHVTPTQIQAAGLPVTSAVGQGTFMAAGALLAWSGVSLALLFFGGRRRA